MDLFASHTPRRAALEITAQGLIGGNLGPMLVGRTRILRPARHVVREAADRERRFVLVAGGASELSRKPLEDEGIEDGRRRLELKEERRVDEPAVAASTDGLDPEAKPLQIAQSRCR